MVIMKKPISTLAQIGREPPEQSIRRKSRNGRNMDEGGDDPKAEIAKMISGFSMSKSVNNADGPGLAPYPIKGGDTDYSNWRGELQRMTPNIEETLTSIWRIANIYNPVELAQAKFESQMCHDEIFAQCHQRTRQKRFLMRRKMLAEEALLCWNDGMGDVWQVPDEIWDELHLYDPDYQNAVMDLSIINNQESAMRAVNIWRDTCRTITEIDESVARDKANRTYADHSQVIDALLQCEPGDLTAFFDTVKKNSTAYW